MWGLGFWQMFVILVIFLVFFGPGKLPDLGTSMGEAIKNFKKSVKDEENDKKEELIEDKNSGEETGK
jgi:sec-independent protein translocase protein TatA